MRKAFESLSVDCYKWHLLENPISRQDFEFRCYTMNNCIITSWLLGFSLLYCTVLYCTVDIRKKMKLGWNLGFALFPGMFRPECDTNLRAPFCAEIMKVRGFPSATFYTFVACWVSKRKTLYFYCSYQILSKSFNRLGRSIVRSLSTAFARVEG
jgi:hypothetical protein